MPLPQKPLSIPPSAARFGAVAELDAQILANGYAPRNEKAAPPLATLARHARSLIQPDGTLLSPEVVTARLTALEDDAGGGGGGGLHPGEEVAYVYPQTGNNGTADGTAAAPYATVQAAFDNGFRIFLLGQGSAGTLTLPGSGSTYNLRFRGMGAGISTIAIATAGNHANVYDIGRYSVIFGSISTSADYSDAGSLQLFDVQAGDVSCDGYTNSEPGGAGTNGGNFYGRGCLLNSLYLRGGDGGNGTDSVSGGNGGSSGNFELVSSRVSGQISVRYGYGGSENGYGGGSDGSTGTALATFSTFESVEGTPSSRTYTACVIEGTFHASVT